MNAEDLIAALSQLNPKCVLKIAMWYGPGSPDAECYDIVETRNFPGQFWICGTDATRRTKGRGVSAAKLAAAQSLWDIADRLRREGDKLLEETDR